MSVAIEFKDVGNEQRELVGGKGFALCVMAREGLSVPAGICITTEAYLNYLAETGLRFKILRELNRKRFEAELVNENETPPATMCTNNWVSPGCVPGNTALRVRTCDPLSESRMRENRTSGSMSGRVETEHGWDIEAPANERVGYR